MKRLVWAVAMVAISATPMLTVPIWAQEKPAADLSAAASSKYLKTNAEKTGVITVPALQYEVLKTGTGAPADRHDCVSVNYKGTLIDGTVFDQTKDKPAVFPAYLLIPGWTIALSLMHEGDVWRLVIPPALAYGHKGAGEGLIPPDQTLIFEVELVKVAKPVRGRCS